jgi:hypothetical protein
VPADRSQHSADETLGRPAGQADTATRPRDPDQLARGAGVVGAEHHADGGEHEVERRVGVGKVLGVGLGELDGELLGRRPAARDVEQLGYVVHAVGAGGPAGRRQGDVPGAGGDVEHPGPGEDAEVVDEVLGHRDCDGGDLVVVTAAPDALLLVAELGVVGGDGHAGASLMDVGRGRGRDGVRWCGW